MTLTTDLKHDHQRRLVNQRQFRRYFVNCRCERGCPVCAYTGLVSKGHARHTGVRGAESLMGTNTTDPEAMDRFRAAREERDRCAARYETAGGSPGELAAFTDLQAAEQQLAARKAWLSWTDRAGPSSAS